MSDAIEHEVSVVRSEEQLLASTVRVPVQRAVVRKVIVEEQRTVAVTVRHEEFRLDYEAVPAVPVAPLEPDPAPIELVLHEERIEIVRTVVPVERVVVGTRRVTEQQAVTGTVRAERVEVDGETLPTGAETGTGRHRG